MLQAGANGNVLVYNFSTDPYWDNTPNNTAGDIALHGNYIYANLFEQNIVQNIVIDNSHGPNGPHNTFLRNRGSLFGILFSATNSPEQNFLGNEVPNTSFPYSLVNYNLQGAGHFEHGNNDKDTIKPVGTQALSDLSYYYSSCPSFVPPNQWAAIGIPNVMGSGSIPAADRFAANNLFAGFCSSLPLPIVQLHTQDWEGLSIYPNPTSDQIHLKASKAIQHIYIYNQLGQLMENYTISNQKELDIDLSSWLKGLYILEISYTDGSQESQQVIKS